MITPKHYLIAAILAGLLTWLALEVTDWILHLPPRWDTGEPHIIVEWRER